MSTLTQSEYAAYWNEAISFQQYIANVEAEAATNPTIGNSKYVPLNWKRMQRITKTTELSPAALQVVAELKQKDLLARHHRELVRRLGTIDTHHGKAGKASKGMIELRFIYPRYPPPTS